MECKYCNTSVDGSRQLIMCHKEFDGDADTYLNTMHVYGNQLIIETILLTGEDATYLNTINYCPMCGRKLIKTNEKRK